MNFTQRHSSSRCAVTLLEVLVVVGVMMILFALLVPTVRGPSSAIELSGAAERWADEIKIARQLAITSGELVQVRIIRVDEPDADRIQLWRGRYDPDGSVTFEPARPALPLPTGIRVSRDDSLSPLLRAGRLPDSGTESFPGLGSTPWIGWTHGPDGVTPGLPLEDRFFTLVSDQNVDDPAPANFATLQIPTRMGVPEVFRP